MRRIEALLDAISSYTLYSQPDSLQYQFRNPLGLQQFCSHAQWFKNCPICRHNPPPNHHKYDDGRVAIRNYDLDTGMRIFRTHMQGYQHALQDLEIKCGDKSKSKVRGNSSIKELIRAYNLPDGTAVHVARYLRKALADESINENTPINSFMTAREKEVALAG